MKITSGFFYHSDIPSFKIICNTGSWKSLSWFSLSIERASVESYSSAKSIVDVNNCLLRKSVCYKRAYNIKKICWSLTFIKCGGMFLFVLWTQFNIWYNHAQPGIQSIATTRLHNVLYLALYCFHGQNTVNILEIIHSCRHSTWQQVCDFMLLFFFQAKWQT